MLFSCKRRLASRSKLAPLWRSDPRKLPGLSLDDASSPPSSSLCDLPLPSAHGAGSFSATDGRRSSPMVASSENVTGGRRSPRLRAGWRTELKANSSIISLSRDTPPSSPGAERDLLPMLNGDGAGSWDGSGSSVSDSSSPSPTISALCSRSLPL